MESAFDVTQAWPANELDNHGLFDEKPFIQFIKDKLLNNISATIFKNLNNIKFFPVFVSKNFYKPDNNIFLVGDAFFAFPPSFAQGASQSIEGASELFASITGAKRLIFKTSRTKKPADAGFFLTAQDQ